MTTASNRHPGAGASGGRTWVFVLAATGWALITAVAVLLATGTWSIGPTSVDDSIPADAPTPASEPATPPAQGTTPAHRATRRPPAPRADHDGLAPTRPLALIPQQSARHER